MFDDDHEPLDYDFLLSSRTVQVGKTSDPIRPRFGGFLYDKREKKDFSLARRIFFRRKGRRPAQKPKFKTRKSRKRESIRKIVLEEEPQGIEIRHTT